MIYTWNQLGINEITNLYLYGTTTTSHAKQIMIQNNVPFFLSHAEDRDPAATNK